MHIYPWQKTAAARASAIASQDVTLCGDGARTALVRETMQTYRDLAAAGRVTAVIYFSWDSDPWAKTPNAGSVFRCGALTPAGRAALKP